MGLMAGVGRCDITPIPGTPQGGWGAQTHQRGIGADMPLYATALVISSGDVTASIIAVDGIGFDSGLRIEIIDAIVRLTGLPRDNIRLSCTHTHSGPNTFRLSAITEGLDMALSYLKELPLRIAGAVWQAQQHLKPVRCAAASGTCEINVNRRLKLSDGRIVVGRNWTGPADSTVRVVRFDDLDENPIATLVHFACHPTIVGWQSQLFTPDYPGVVRQIIEQEVGGVCLFLQGAAGNVGPRRGFTGDLRIYRRLGKMLGLEASKLALSIETVPRHEQLVRIIQSGTAIAIYEDEPSESYPQPFGVCSRLVKLPLRHLQAPETLELEAEQARNELEQIRRENGTEEQLQAKMSRLVQATMRVERARAYYGKTHLDWQLQAIRIGSIVLLSVPGDPFIEISQKIVAGSPFAHTLFSGYSNGGLNSGYLPFGNAFEEGGYEVDTSPFSPEAADLLIKEALQVLQELTSNSASKDHSGSAHNR